MRLPDPGFWNDKTVLVTGHTGFKGSWLSMWLDSMGATVCGLSLNPNTEPNLFTVADLYSSIDMDMRADIRDKNHVDWALKECSPDIVFHLAAQPLVHESYHSPLVTLDTNIMGSANILESIRTTSSVKAAVMVTTDKVYENREWVYPYRENDSLGAGDPYSTSKACMELVVDCYRRSFPGDRSVSSVRAGNVIGGGDWSKDRLVPDAIRAFMSEEMLVLRNPGSIRPWQHVLDPLCGYLLLAESQWMEPGVFSRAWNFGPDNCMESTVGELADALAVRWGDSMIRVEKLSGAVHECGLLGLDSSMSRKHLGWRPRWNLAEAVVRTVDWYKAMLAGKDMHAFSFGQIKEYLC